MCWGCEHELSGESMAYICTKPGWGAILFSTNPASIFRAKSGTHPTLSILWRFIFSHLTATENSSATVVLILGMLLLTIVPLVSLIFTWNVLLCRRLRFVKITNTLFSCSSLFQIIIIIIIKKRRWPICFVMFVVFLSERIGGLMHVRLALIMVHIWNALEEIKKNVPLNYYVCTFRRWLLFHEFIIKSFYFCLWLNSMLSP